MKQPLVALDIGSTKIACAIGLPHEHAPGFELLGSSLIPYPSRSEVWLGDLLVVARAIEQAIEATAVTGEVHRALVAANPPSLHSAQARVTIALGDEPVTVRAQDLERLQRCALDQTLAVDREPLLVESLGCAGNGFEGVRNPRGLAATRLAGHFHVLTIPMAARRAIVQAVESAGLEVEQLTPTLPVALAGVADAQLCNKRVLLIDVGGLTTDIGLFVEGVLWNTVVVPWGGLTLAGTIARQLQVTIDQALTWSLEGIAGRRSDTRAIIDAHWAQLQPALEGILTAQARPDAVLVTGRGALIDGFVEWTERLTRIPTSLGRSARLTQLGDVSRQVGLTPAVGLLELATRTSNGVVSSSPRFFNRLIERTRTILTEYF